MEAAAAAATAKADATAATVETTAAAAAAAAAAEAAPPISKDGVFTAGYLWRCEEKASAGKNVERKMSGENPKKTTGSNCLLKVEKRSQSHRFIQYTILAVGKYAKKKKSAFID